MSSSASSVLVFGAYGGIGSALCHALWSEGRSLILAGRNAEALAALTQSAEDHPSHSVTVDAADFDAVADAMAAAKVWGDENGAPLSGVVNCVGSVVLKPAHLTTAEQYREVLAANLDSAFAVVRAAGKVMRKAPDGAAHGCGSVVLCSSAAAQVGMANHEAIAAAKAGVEGLVRSAAASYAPRGLRINAVAPGLVRTAQTESITGNARALAASEAMHPLRRVGEPAEVAAAIAFLLRPESSWMTGEVLAVDGGLAHVRSTPRA